MKSARKQENSPDREEQTLASWSDVVFDAMTHLQTASLRDIYDRVTTSPRAEGRDNWHPTVRQTLQSDARYVRVGRGQWSLRSLVSEAEAAEFDKLRREQCTLRPRKKT